MKYLSHIAEEVEDWVRVEAEISGKYSHQWTEAVMECQTDEAFKNLILSAILDRFMFFYTKTRKPHKITRLMLKLLDDKTFGFTCPNVRDNDLERSIRHLIKNSGLFPTMYKIEAIWGEEGLNKFMEYLMEKYQEFEPNEDHRLWLRKRFQQYQSQGKPWTIKTEKKSK